MSCRSTATMFGATSSSWPPGRSKNSNWPSTLPDRKPSTTPTCTPVSRPPMRSATLPTGFCSASRSTSGVITLRMPPALASIHAGRSTTRVAAVTGGSCRWVSSATWSAASAVARYSSPTTSSASRRDTAGDAGLNRLAARAATSQSISEAMTPTLPAQAARAASRRAAAAARRGRPPAARGVGRPSRSAMKANASSRPAASWTSPASAETPVRVPVLARTRPAAGAAGRPGSGPAACRTSPRPAARRPRRRRSPVAVPGDHGEQARRAWPG